MVISLIATPRFTEVMFKLIYLSFVNQFFQICYHKFPFIFSSRTVVFESLSDCFPYIGSECDQQVNYVKNLLLFTEYCPNAMSYILNIIIGR